ncbi:kappa-casein precursor [Sesbania bispinosa]|nr:kappa-casein precursor [Sesbania bispinosa]
MSCPWPIVKALLGKGVIMFMRNGYSAETEQEVVNFEVVLNDSGDCRERWWRVRLHIN